MFFNGKFVMFQEIKKLSALRKNQQLMSFYMLFVQALLLAYTAKAYVVVFGADGLIAKDYLISLFGLILLIPFLGKTVNKYPIKTFHMAVILEIFAVFCYYLTNIQILPELFLPLGTLILMSSVFIMRPLVTRVDSQVTNACPEYSLLKSKLDQIYIAVGAIFGLAFLGLDISSSFVIPLLIILLLISRYYRNLVFKEIYLGEVSQNSYILVDLVKIMTIIMFYLPLITLLTIKWLKKRIVGGFDYLKFVGGNYN